MGGGGGREREHGLDPSAVELICVIHLSFAILVTSWRKGDQEGTWKAESFPYRCASQDYKEDGGTINQQGESGSMYWSSER